METHLLALPAGYRIESYEIQAVLGKGGFGITYRALDLQLDKQVAIKELLIDTIATRVEGSTVVPQRASLQEDWDWARESFRKEAKILARFSHPAIVGVHRIIEANGTGYMVMDYVEGETYEAKLRRIGREPDQASLMAVVGPLLDGLNEVHASGLLHRDIKPENILINRRGQPVLIDFGTARSTVAATMTMTMMGTAGYMPIEQSQTKGNKGPWTDIYAIGVMMCRAITGEKPPSATDRIMEDEFQWLSYRQIPGYSEQFLQAVDWALRVRPEERPQDIGQWGPHLFSSTPAASPTPSPAVEESVPNTPEEPPPGFHLDWVPIQDLAKKPKKIRRVAVHTGRLAWLGVGLVIVLACINIPALPQGQHYLVLVVMGAFFLIIVVSAVFAREENYQLGLAYLRGEGVTKDAAEAVKWFRKAAAAGNQRAEAWLKQNGYPVNPTPAPPTNKHKSGLPGLLMMLGAVVLMVVVGKCTSFFTESRMAEKQAQATEVESEKIAAEESPYENSLGMKFVPVPGTDVLFSVWDTRVRDYAAFVAAGSDNAGTGWKNPGFSQTSNDPVVNVNWEQAKAFCKWLTEKERGEGKILDKQEYRLPTDAEWSVSVGLPPEIGNTPQEKDGKVMDVYPWGKQWPPPKGAGNYDPSLGVDSYENTSPVGSFSANRFGLYDMGGNVWQWCEDDYGGGGAFRVLRGGSWWSNSYRERLLSSFRFNDNPGFRNSYYGFRCVLVGGSSR